MKIEHKDLTSVELALLTWYELDNSKHFDKEHPTIKLAGEIGELLDLYAKHIFKPGFDWMDCKHCGHNEDWHGNDKELCNHIYCLKVDKYYTPKVLDELGDIWYYLRILAYQHSIEFDDYYAYAQDGLSVIKGMYSHAAAVLDAFDDDTIIESLQEIYEYLLLLLEKLGYTIDQLTKLNYYKLNSESSNHGWKDAV